MVWNEPDAQAVANAIAVLIIACSYTVGLAEPVPRCRSFIAS